MIHWKRSDFLVRMHCISFSPCVLLMAGYDRFWRGPAHTERRFCAQAFGAWQKDHRLPGLPQHTSRSAGFLRIRTNWFGMFLHFGINTDWSDSSLPTSYLPETIDTDVWFAQCRTPYLDVSVSHRQKPSWCFAVRIAYCIPAWKAVFTQWSVVAALAASCRKYGVKIGLYYSSDRRETRYSDDEAYVCYMERQLKELLDRKIWRSHGTVVRWRLG